MNPITILLVEDNIGDQKLVDFALKNSVTTDLQIVGDGREAIRYLKKDGKYANASRPHLVLLDLNLPVRSGVEVLAEIRRDPQLKDIPVAIFTGAKPTKELAETCQLNANFYIVKPDGADKYFAIVKALEEYCRNLLRFPALEKDFSGGLRTLLKVV